MINIIWTAQNPFEIALWIARMIAMSSHTAENCEYVEDGGSDEQVFLSRRGGSSPAHPLAIYTFYLMIQTQITLLRVLHQIHTLRCLLGAV